MQLSCIRENGQFVPVQGVTKESKFTHTDSCLVANDVWEQPITAKSTYIRHQLYLCLRRYIMDPTASVLQASAPEVHYLCGGESLNLVNLPCRGEALIFMQEISNSSTLLMVHAYFPLTACGTNNSIKPQDPIRCRSCGYRILYKTRTKRSKRTVAVICKCEQRALIVFFCLILSFVPQ